LAVPSLSLEFDVDLAFQEYVAHFGYVTIQSMAQSMAYGVADIILIDFVEYM